jgi:hypothetical protein
MRMHCCGTQPLAEVRFAGGKYEDISPFQFQMKTRRLARPALIAGLMLIDKYGKVLPILADRVARV